MCVLKAFPFSGKGKTHPRCRNRPGECVEGQKSGNKTEFAESVSCMRLDISFRIFFTLQVCKNVIILEMRSVTLHYCII